MIFQDGSFRIEKLDWADWGSPVAKATGKSNSDDDKPSVAEGTHTITWAKVRLYNPGAFHGRRVYRCIGITVPPSAHAAPSCLQRTAGGVALFPPGSGTPVGGETSDGARHLSEFLSPISASGAPLGTGLEAAIPTIRTVGRSFRHTYRRAERSQPAQSPTPP
jgi:hypothetical protein